MAANTPISIGIFNEAELDAELEKGYQDMLSGQTKSAKQIFSDIRRDYGLWHIEWESQREEKP